jgi:hypothetical protein
MINLRCIKASTLCRVTTELNVFVSPGRRLAVSRLIRRHAPEFASSWLQCFGASAGRGHARGVVLTGLGSV